MKPVNTIMATMIAPCGMICGLCYAHLREKKSCPGCYGNDSHKPKSCLQCSIKNCPNLPESQYCSSCSEYPCRRLKQFDKRYISKYKMSPIDNLQRINDLGLEAFIQDEIMRWTCQSCGQTICVHYNNCQICGEKRTC